MIFVTVGGQGSFDRLVKTVDQWAEETRRDDVFAQVGCTRTPPKCIQWVEMLTPAEFRRHTLNADVIISHAGMGTILTALDLGKRILVMPRLAHMGEQRNEHQLATAVRLREIVGLPVAVDEAELRYRLARLDDVRACKRAAAETHSDLVNAIRNFIDAG